SRTRSGHLRNRTRHPGCLRRIPVAGNRARAGRPLKPLQMTNRISLGPYLQELDRLSPMRWSGEVTEVVGLLVESRRPNVAIGDCCEVLTAAGRPIRTQVIGFRNGRVLSMPLEEIDGLQLGDPVTARSEDARVDVGPGLLGRVIDGFSKP